MTGILVVVVGTGLLLVDQDMLRTVPIATAAAILLVVLARAAGLSWQDLGLGRTDLASGLRWGLASAALVALGYAVVAGLPVAQSGLDDDTMPATLSEVGVRVLVVIPLRTVLIEELAFRGVLWGLLRRRGSPLSATCWSSIAFGLWHVPAGLRLVDSNQALADATAGSSWAAAGIVLTIVVLTGLAGLVLAELRRRSGSLLAPALLHWATNSIGTLLSAVR